MVAPLEKNMNLQVIDSSDGAYVCVQMHTRAYDNVRVHASMCVCSSKTSIATLISSHIATLSDYKNQLIVYY